MISGTVTRSQVALTALLAALTIWVFVYKAAPKMTDFEVWWKAASRAAHAEPLYRESDGHFVFKYLPAFAVVAIPMGLLPLATAKWSGFSARSRSSWRSCRWRSGFLSSAANLCAGSSS